MRSEDSPRLMTPGSEAMMRLWEDAGEADRLCRDVRVLTGGSGPPLDTWEQGQRGHEPGGAAALPVHLDRDGLSLWGGGLTCLGCCVSRSVWLGSRCIGLTTRRPALSPPPPLAKLTPSHRICWLYFTPGTRRPHQQVHVFPQQRGRNGAGRFGSYRVPDLAAGWREKRRPAGW